MKYILIIFSAFLLVVAACSKKPVHSGNKEFNIMVVNNEEIKSIYQDTLSASLNHFAFKLYRECASENENFFFSPYSISTALALAYIGAREKTAAAFRQTAGFYEPLANFNEDFERLGYLLITDSSKVISSFRIANSIWLATGQPVLPSFVADADKYHGAGITNLDFISESENARNTINKWVEEKTENKIKDLIPPGMLNATTRAVLVNAVYFLEKWKKEFDPKSTTPLDFYTGIDQKIQVPFMIKYSNDYKYYEDNDIKAIELPYKNDKFSMIIILPVEKTGLKKSYEKLEPAAYQDLIKSLRFQHVDVSIPKFKMTFSLPLTEKLKNMGMQEAFSNTADFSGISGKKDLSFDQVIHKAYVDVNEEGTEAAAATAIFMRVTATPNERYYSFVADHPFVFIIKENNTQTILFMGQVTNPAL